MPRNAVEPSKSTHPACSLRTLQHRIKFFPLTRATCAQSARPMRALTSTSIHTSTCGKAASSWSRSAHLGLPCGLGLSEQVVATPHRYNARDRGPLLEDTKNGGSEVSWTGTQTRFWFSTIRADSEIWDQRCDAVRHLPSG